MDPGQEKMDRNRGVALWGDLVISVTSFDGRVIATDRDTGKVVWERNLRDQPDLTLNAAPLALADSILVGASGGDAGVRDWLVSLDAKTGDVNWKTFSIPAPRRTRLRDLEGQEQRLADRRRRLLRHRLLRPRHQRHLLGRRQPDAEIRLVLSSRRQPLHQQRARNRCGDREAALVSTSTRRTTRWTTTKPAPTSSSTARSTARTASFSRMPARNGFFYSFDRLNGQFLKAIQYVPTVTWTKGIDPKTGRPLDYDPGKDLQTYADAVAKILTGAKSSGVCPGVPGGSNFWSAAYSERTGLVYVPELEGCTNITRDQTRHVRGKFDGGDFGYDGRLKSGLVVVDPATGAVVKRKEMAYANTSGALATAGGLIVTALIDGTVVALDDQTLEELWSFNVGTGINAPPMTYAVDGRQYIAIATGLTRNSMGRLATTPEKRNLGKSATMIFVFAL